jgi:hypothetical protein
VTQPLTGIGGTPAVEAAAPTRPAAKDDATKAAEGFERLLLGQLTRTLLDSALPSATSGPAAGAYKEQLPDALTEALMSGGGIGLAAQLKEHGS